MIIKCQNNDTIHEYDSRMFNISMFHNNNTMFEYSQLTFRDKQSNAVTAVTSSLGTLGKPPLNSRYMVGFHLQQGSVNHTS